MIQQGGNGDLKIEGRRWEWEREGGREGKRRASKNEGERQRGKKTLDQVPLVLVGYGNSGSR